MAGMFSGVSRTAAICSMEKNDLPTQLPPEPETVTTDSAYLVPPEDAELEQIIQETKAMDEPVIYTPQEPAAGPFRDEEYREAFGEGKELEAVFDELAPSQEEPPVIPDCRLWN